MLSRVRCFPLVAVAVFMLAGCADSGTPSPDGFQEALLEDGVTESEYRLAVDAARSCLSDDGWIVSESRLALDGLRLEFGVSPQGAAAPGAPTDAEATDAFEAVDRCREQYVDDVESAFLSAQTLTGAEQQAVMADLIACLDGLGVAGVLAGDSKEQVTAKMVDSLGEGDELIPGLRCLEAHLVAFPR